MIRDCAVISIEPSMSEIVWGALYELDGTDIQRLDEREGYDKRRDRALTLAGYRVLRLQAELVMRELPLAVALVREALGG